MIHLYQMRALSPVLAGIQISGCFTKKVQFGERLFELTRAEASSRLDLPAKSHGTCARAQLGRLPQRIEVR
jgi:hypothetical protein